MGLMTRLAAAAATAGLLLGVASATHAQKPTTPTKPTEAVKPTTVQKPTEAIKPATADKTGVASKPGAPDAAVGTGGKTPPPPGLKGGDYTCAGGGAAFKVTGPGAYGAAAGGAAGTFVVTGGAIAFTGGPLAGQAGHDLKDNKFMIGTATTCTLTAPAVTSTPKG